MTPELPFTRGHLETTRRSLVNKIIKNSIEGKLDWDFSKFDDLARGQVAEARVAGLTFVSTKVKDEKAEFSIFRGEGTADSEVVDTFSGFKARLLRVILERIAWQDKDYIERQRQEERNLANEERLDPKVLEDMTMHLSQVLELLPV